MPEQTDQGPNNQVGESEDSNLSVEESEGIPSGTDTGTVTEGEESSAGGQGDAVSELEAEIDQLISERESLKKSQRHANKKITQQGQELSSKDAEINQLTQRLDYLEQQTRQSQQQSRTEDYYGEEASPEISQVTERQNLLENALHGLLNQQEQLRTQLSEMDTRQGLRSRSLEYQKRFNMPEKYADAIVEAEDEGDHIASKEIWDKVRRLQEAKEQSQLGARRRRGLGANTSSQSGTPPPPSKEAAQKELEGLSGSERFDKIINNPSLLDELIA